MASQLATKVEQVAQTKITSSSILDQEIAPNAVAADDSDFIDSDAEAEAEAEDAEIERAMLAEPHHEKIFPSDASKCFQPLHQLIPISRRLWFTYFKEPVPLPQALNRNRGTTSAWIDDESYHLKGQEQKELPKDFFWFNVDDDLVYLSFFHDWGPLNVAMFYRFCLHVHHLLTDETIGSKHLVLYTSSRPTNKANAALLAALYAMVIDKITPADAFFPFSELEFRPFRDAGYGRPDFNLSIQDILYGMHRALSVNLLDLATFNLDEYEYYEQVQNGDWNWITPNFIAFASPNDREYVAALRANGGQPPESMSRLRRPNPTFAKTIKYFKERGVKLVVRLNNPLYDKAAFEEAGISHVDMYFDDGSNPSEAILRDFISRADEVVSSGGSVAVHCKAGLGRTGVLIGAYLIWKHGFTAQEVIGFMRLMRPGCVVGPQQHFMYENFVEWVRWGVHDKAVKEAKEAFAAERAVLLEKLQKDRPLKRAATPDDDQEDPFDSAGNVPVTPRAKKIPHVMAATVAPAVKPTPCVGQPRKSPSPSRKRLVGAAPATIARLENGKNALASWSSGSSCGSDSGQARAFSSQSQFEKSMSAGTPPPAADHVALADQGEKVGAESGAGGGGGGGPVLAVAQHLNVQSQPNAVTEVLQEKVTTPVMTRVRSHERSRSAISIGICVQEMTPTSPSSLSREPPFRASPDIKSRYQLRDASRLPQLKRPASPTAPGVEELDAKCPPSPASANANKTSEGQASVASRPRSRTPSAASTTSTRSSIRSVSHTRATAATLSVSSAAQSRKVNAARQPSGTAPTARVSAGKNQQSDNRRTTTSNPDLKLRGTSARVALGARRTIKAEVALNGSDAKLAQDLETRSTAAGSHRATSTSKPGLKRPRIVSPELKAASAFPGSQVMAPSLAGSRVVSGSRLGRNVRRRRSSLGEADIDVQA